MGECTDRACGSLDRLSPVCRPSFRPSGGHHPRSTRSKRKATRAAGDRPLGLCGAGGVMGTRGRADAVPRPALLVGGAGTIARARQRARKRGRDRWVSAVDKLRFARPVAWGAGRGGRRCGQPVAVAALKPSSSDLAWTARGLRARAHSTGSSHWRFRAGATGWPTFARDSHQAGVAAPLPGNSSIGIERQALCPPARMYADEAVRLSTHSPRAASKSS